jgi:hypothetical protein
LEGDRCHIAAPSIGRGTDINLIPQLHALNISRDWRAFERHLRATTRAPFFAASSATVNSCADARELRLANLSK